MKIWSYRINDNKKSNLIKKSLFLEDLKDKKDCLWERIWRINLRKSKRDLIILLILALIKSWNLLAHSYINGKLVGLKEPFTLILFFSVFSASPLFNCGRASSPTNNYPHHSQTHFLALTNYSLSLKTKTTLKLTILKEQLQCFWKLMKKIKRWNLFLSNLTLSHWHLHQNLTPMMFSISLALWNEVWSYLRIKWWKWNWAHHQIYLIQG